MKFVDFAVSQNDLDRRIDKVIRIFLPELQLSAIYKALRKGLIKVNQKKIFQDYRTQENDIINIADFLINQESQEPLPNKNLSLPLPEIVFENQHILIINKPYDVLVHGSDSSLDKQVFQYYKNKTTEKSLSFTPGPLHRLDRKTTGLLAFSMSLEGARWFTENIKNHSIQKTYAAILQGELKQEKEFQDYITKDSDNSSKGFKTVKATKESIQEDSQLAWTTITPVSYGKYQGKKITLAKLIIHTGKTHQIRAQSALHGFPLLGDTAYGGMKISEKQDFFLQACKLNFEENPVGLPPQIEIPFNKEFKKLVFSCGIEKTGL